VPVIELAAPEATVVTALRELEAEDAIGDARSVPTRVTPLTTCSARWATSLPWTTLLSTAVDVTRAAAAPCGVVWGGGGSLATVGVGSGREEPPSVAPALFGAALFATASFATGLAGWAVDGSP
jgi:hypothetical protein